MVFYSLQLEWEKYSLENKQSIGGKYFDDHRQRLETAMQNKNAQLNSEWRERYDERERKKQQQKKRDYQNNHKIEDSLFTKEEEERIRIYEEKN